MPIVLITGPIASGKSAIGKALAAHWGNAGHPTLFIDLDEEMLGIHGSFDWDNASDRMVDWLEARRAAATQANDAIAVGARAVISGPFYLQEEFAGLTDHLVGGVPLFLYVLQAPLEMRLIRNRERVNVSRDSELVEQQRAIEALPTTIGTPIRNSGSIQDVVEEITGKVDRGIGRMK